MAVQPLTEAPLIDVVIPVYNEEAALELSVRRLERHLTRHFPYPSRITIADNGSTDRTLDLARRLAAQLPRVRVLHLEDRGRGLALRTAWSRSDAAVLAYMDVDLSTDLNALLPLVAPLVSRHSHVSTGRRLGRGSRTVRSRRRELISRCYNLLLRLFLGARFRDAQCGFKAVRADVARELLPAIEDDGWFFDTELLTLAQRAGLRIHEVPVDWVEDPDTRVDLVSTALADLRGIWRLATRRTLPSSAAVRQVASFAGIGVASSVVYFGLYWLLRSVTPALVANLIAQLATAVANTAANRRLTFGVKGSQMLARDHTGGLAALAVSLAVTTSSLGALHAIAPEPTRLIELIVLGSANLASTLVRFVFLRAWIFHPRRIDAAVLLLNKEQSR
jgi:putative flippase GtrA